MVDYTKQEKVALLRDFLNVVGTETEGVEVKITQDADNGMRFYSEPQVLIDVKNDSGAQIDKGTPVYVSGEHGGSGKPTIEKAKADAAATMPAIGLVLTDLADQAEGYVLAAGTLLNLDTDTPGFDAGDALYVSPTTAGDLTKTRPTGDTQLVQKVALVARRHATAGSVIVMGAGRTNDTPNDSYSGRYDTEAETQRAVNDATDPKVEIYYTARPDGDGYAESEVDDGGLGAGESSRRRLYYSDKFDADPDTSGDWTLYTTQPADDTAFATCKASLLAGLSDTDGTANTRGTLPVSLKMERTVITSGLLLDTYTGAAAAYSVRLLRTAYTGDAIRIREDSGNTETDIGFNGDGDLDTAAIASHCGANNGYVVTWYDQSTVGNDLTQSTTADQLQIYDGSAGAVLTNNGKPCLKPQDYTDTMSATAAFAFSSHLHVFTVADWPAYVTDTTHAAMIAKYQSTDRYLLTGGRNNGFDINGNTGGSSGGGWTMRLDGAAWAPSNNDRPAVRTAMQAGPRIVRMAFASLAGAWTQIDLGYPIGSSSFHGYELQELVFYNSDQTSNDSGIESNINAYYLIY